MMPAEIAFQPGSVIAGKYVVERVLGRGGMGIVIAARHIELDERFALKFLLPEGAAQTDIVARFMREGRAAVKIRSEHVARIFDVGKLEHGLPYIVMEYLEGQDLAALVERGPLPITLAADYLLQACEAVAEAHALGMVHRDLKPANLFLVHRVDGSPCVKVLDFGISKAAVGANSEASMTRTSAIMGSPLYMSPEQMTSARDVDARSDIWALGVILYELVTGRAPFQADTLPQVCGLILQTEPAPASEFVASAPPWLDSVLRGCLAKRPSDRYASVAVFAHALASLASPQGQHSAERIARVLKAPARPAMASQSGVGEAPAQATGNASQNAVPAGSNPLGANSAAGPAQTLGSWGTTGNQAPAARKRFPVVMLSVAAVLVLVIAGLSVALFRQRASDGSDAPTAAASESSAVHAAETSGSAASGSASVQETQPSASAQTALPGNGRKIEPAPMPMADAGAFAHGGEPLSGANGATRPARGSERPAQKPPRAKTPSGRPQRPAGGDLFEDRK